MGGFRPACQPSVTTIEQVYGMETAWCDAVARLTGCPAEARRSPARASADKVHCTTVQDLVFIIAERMLRECVAAAGGSSVARHGL